MVKKIISGSTPEDVLAKYNKYANNPKNKKQQAFEQMIHVPTRKVDEWLIIYGEWE